MATKLRELIEKMYKTDEDGMFKLSSEIDALIGSDYAKWEAELTSVYLEVKATAKEKMDNFNEAVEHWFAQDLMDFDPTGMVEAEARDTQVFIWQEKAKCWDTHIEFFTAKMVFERVYETYQNMNIVLMHE